MSHFAHSLLIVRKARNDTGFPPEPLSGNKNSFVEESAFPPKRQLRLHVNGKHLTKYRLRFHLPYKLLQPRPDNGEAERINYCSIGEAMIKPIKESKPIDLKVVRGNESGFQF
ncbi:hypothetical protein AAFN90_17275 [Erwiniaceae bacterium CAU 1747]